MMVQMFRLLMFFCFNFGGVRLLDYERNEINFEKILGVRPPTTTAHNLLFEQSASIPVTLDCLTKCSDRNDCAGFILFYNTSSCYWHETIRTPDVLHGTVPDANIGWFLKSSLKAARCHKDWIFEVIPGATLIDTGRKTLATPVTRHECQQYCLNETTFACRSANFKPATGSCTLTTNDRHLQPNAYRVSTFNDEYLENQCSEISASEFCDFEEYENTTLAHADELFPNRTKDECQRTCDKNASFGCRGFSLVPRGNGAFDCRLSSEDSIVHGPKLLVTLEGGYYYERARCLNVSVYCSDTHLTVRYRPEAPFNGRIYMQGYSDRLECYAKGHAYDTIVLSIPIFGNQCGLTQAKSTYHNRTLLSNTLVIQYNNLIQTQGDRLIRVGCIFGNDTRVLVGTGVNISSRPYVGGSILNTTGVTPTVMMRVLDYATQTEATDTQIGQELEMVVEVTHSAYDIWASHLVAMTERSDESIFLLDDKGCPTNPTIFPAMMKTRTNGTSKLVAVFQAFKFASSPVVRFSVIVQFCTRTCRPNDCGNDTLSFVRAKRNTTTVTNTDNTTDGVIAKVFEIPLEFVMIVRDPKISTDRLVFGDRKILVAGYDIVTNEVCVDFSLLIGVVVTWGLIQVIFVVCCVMLVKRYKRYYEHESMRQSLEQLHRNFGLGFSNLDNRRVHWADDMALT